MLRKGILFFIDSIVFIVDGIVIGFIWLKNYILLVWRKNVFRRWLLNFIDLLDAGVCWLKNYLEGLRVIIQYRIYYKTITRPMKERYRELRRKFVLR